MTIGKADRDGTAHREPHNVHRLWQPKGPDQLHQLPVVEVDIVPGARSVGVASTEEIVAKDRETRSWSDRRTSGPT